VPWIDESEHARLSRIAECAEALTKHPLNPTSPEQARCYREISAAFRRPERGPDTPIDAVGWELV
jgi:hypothetical protein